MVSREKWRLRRLGVAFLAAILLTAWSAQLASPKPIWGELGMAAPLGGGAILLMVVALAIASAKRNIYSPWARSIFSFALSLWVVAGSFKILGLVEEHYGFPASLFGFRSLVLEGLYGYWPTLVVLLGLVFSNLFHPASRTLVDTLLPLPFFVWGLDATLSHWLVFHSSGYESVFALEMSWFGVASAAATLFGLLLATALWRSWLVGMRRLRPGMLAPIAATVAAVFVDWGYSLFVISRVIVEQSRGT